MARLAEAGQLGARPLVETAGPDLAVELEGGNRRAEHAEREERQLRSEVGAGGVARHATGRLAADHERIGAGDESHEPLVALAGFMQRIEIHDQVEFVVRARLYPREGVGVISARLVEENTVAAEGLCERIVLPVGQGCFRPEPIVRAQTLKPLVTPI